MSTSRVAGMRGAGLRIGIDYTAAVRQRAGIGRYTANLVGALVELDHENRYTLFAADRARDSYAGRWPVHVRFRRVPISDRWLHILWQRLRLPLPVQLVTGGLDLFHSPDFVLPPIGRTPALVTVHDLSYLRVPECFVAGFVRYFRRAVTHAVARAAHVVADSNSTRTDLVELLGLDEGKITVLYPGIEARFRPVQDEACLMRVRAAYGLPQRFILGLGTLQPRKNFPALIESFGRLLRECPETCGDLHLVIAGEKGWMCDQIFDAAKRALAPERVHFLGFVRDEDLPILYSLAFAFAFLSRYEGFGLPVLEAMACGVPVVAADNSSLPEVVGDAGLLVDANHTESQVQALANLASDQSLRANLAQAGRRRALSFSWERAGAQLLALYREIAERSAVQASHSHVPQASL